MASRQKHHESGGVELLRTKLAVPRPRPRRVLRPRLDALLDTCLDRALTVVCSPAGFGKTTLVAGWIASSDLSVGWVSLDERDSEPVRFWSYLVAALDGCRPGAGGDAAAMLASRQPPPIEVVLTDILNTVSSISVELLLVLDDYHLISDPAVHRSLEFLLAHIPQNLHLIVMSREELPLPLGALRAQATLTEITARDLRFSREEVAEFFEATIGNALPEHEVASIAEMTEGWAAALQLTALSLEGMEQPPPRWQRDENRPVQPTELASGLSGDRQYLFDYLAEEVFARLDEQERSFLRRTAWLDRFCASLCEAVMDRKEVLDQEGALERSPPVEGRPAQELLAALDRSNLFLIPLDNERTWYRYHRLFREFLEAQARSSLREAEIRAIRIQASEWFRRHSLTNEALYYAFAAEDFNLAAELLTGLAATFFANSDLITLRDWVGRLPERHLEGRAGLCIVYSWALLATGRAPEVERVLRMVERAVGMRADGTPESRDCPPRIRCVLAEVSVIRSSLAFSRFDLEEIKSQSQRALDYLPEHLDDAFFNLPPGIRATAMFNLSLAYENEGDIETALAMFSQALDANRATENVHLVPMILAHMANLHVVQGRLSRAEEIGLEVVENRRGATSRTAPSPLRTLAYVGYGSILLERNRVDESLSYLREGVELARRWANFEGIFPGMVALARAYCALGDIEKAVETIHELEAAAEDPHLPPAASAAVDAYSTFYALRAGAPPEASAVRAREALNRLSGSPYLQESEEMVWCRILCEAGLHGEAIGHLERLAEGMRSGKRFGRLIENRALTSIAEFAAGRREAAHRHLAEALELGRPGGYLRVFLDLGTPMVRLLESAPSLQEYGKLVLAAFRLPVSPPDLVQRRTAVAISDRELEVLRDLASGSSNQETADRLFISVNTVKTHLKNIFAKLEVTSRAQAIVRAHELGLIAPRDESGGSNQPLR